MNRAVLSGLGACLMIMGTVAAADAPPGRLGLTVEDGRFVDGTPGVIVRAVAPGSRAARARSKVTGLPHRIEPGDMIVSFAGQAVESADTFAAQVAAAVDRGDLTVQSASNRQLRRLWVDLAPADGGGPTRLSIGLTVRASDSGILIDAVEPGSPAAGSTDGRSDLPTEIDAGCHLLSIDGQPVRTPAEAAQRLAAAGERIHIEIERPPTPGSPPFIVLCVIGQQSPTASAPAPRP